MKHPRDITEAELAAIQQVTNLCGAEVLRTFTDRYGSTWNIARGLGQPFVRCYVGFDLSKRTEPYIAGPGVIRGH